MKRVLAIASVALRNAVCSRVLAVLMLLMAACAVGLPLTIRGDGTLEGHVRILLAYTLGFSSILLSISAVWSGCAAIAAEMRDRQIHLLMTKPVRPIELWLGKWLGLLALHGAFLVFVFVAVYGMLAWTTRPALLPEEQRQRLREEILVARQTARPEEKGLEEAARAALEAEREAGRLPADADPAEAFRALLHLHRVHFYAVPPGALREWTIPLPGSPDRTRPAFLQFRFSKSELNLESVAGQWFWGPAEAPRGSVAGAWPPEAVHTIPLPPGAIGPERDLRVAFGNADPAGATVFFDPDRGLELLVFRGGFAGNFLRAGLVLFFQIAFLSALGLAAGAIFSMPVAAFVSVSLILMMRLSEYIGQVAQQRHILGGAAGSPALLRALDASLRLVFRILRTALAPLESPDALDLLAGGRLISWSLVGSMFLTQAALYGGALAVLSAWILRRRELGLPTT